jgi:hypothetical protein
MKKAAVGSTCTTLREKIHENLFKKYHEKGYMCVSGRLILVWILNMHYLLIMLSVAQIM